jgi:hypothetical protein
VVSPNIQLPAGYLPQHVQVVINGTCKDCSGTASNR